MRIRDYTPEDEPALREMHAAQGFDYPFPDLSSQLFLTRLVLEDDAGRPLMAVLGRVTCEVYLLAQPRAGTPQERWQRFLAVHEAMRQALHAQGFEDATCWLPPRIERAFGRRLRRLGWVRDAWAAFTRRI
ncbi:MAG TPA: hypothetical protein VEG63_09775 [Candidatus Acidoferrales bacterium]|nr:hypothetical protein [Candidatus Acidoferrales bacterium]